ncbi:MAG: DUF5938 domain-containing protein [Halioglobus sp.]|nr:DUF5938 domain-containing protein [Halioglobus sp.]
MNSNYEVVVYGASGYTGKLIAWQLAERGIPFIAAGRSQARLESEMAKVPELKGFDYQCVEVAHDLDALTSLFSGKKIVYNVVGPFMQLCEVVVKASLKAACHYLDTTGEQDWMLFCEEHYGQPYADAGLLLVPACSWMWAAGNLAAEIALETPGVDSLDIVYCPNGEPSQASTRSFLRMCCQPQLYLENNELLPWPSATSYDVALPGRHRTLKALPWSGGGEPVWYNSDERVANCNVLTSFTNQVVMQAVVDCMNKFEAEYTGKTIHEQEAITNAWADELCSEEPARDHPAVHRTTISCYGRGSTDGVSVTLWATCGYSQTGALASFAVQRILSNKAKAEGFVSPATAFGARNLIQDLSDIGLHCTVDRSSY